MFIHLPRSGTVAAGERANERERERERKTVFSTYVLVQDHSKALDIDRFGLGS